VVLVVVLLSRPHASQQLVTDCGLPADLTQAPLSRRTLHLVFPLERQHTTASAWPHVEREAQRFTLLLQLAGKVPASTRAFATLVAHRTY